jgi:hypothetical protein
MRIILVALLTLLTACAASTNGRTSAPCDASWTPPEEMQLSVNETATAPKPLELPALASPKPNKSATEKHALHAANY